MAKLRSRKFLPKQVVIDNNGTYELITLFGDATIAGIVEMAAKPAQRLAEPANTETTAPSSVNV